ncbi:MAG: response regulator [Bryobacterales bacterium]|nr:response regulator [Bryobacterales bacterium]
MLPAIIPQVSAGCWLAVIALCLAIVASPAQAGQYRFRILDQSYGLDDLVVRDLLQDRAGFLWVATHTGLYRFDGRSFRRYSTAEGLASNWVTNLLEATDGTLWVATGKGVSRQVGNRFQIVLHASDSLRFSPAHGTPMVAGRRGGVYLSPLTGLYSVELAPPAPPGPPMGAVFPPPLRVRRLLPNPSESPNVVAPLAVDADGNLCTFRPGNRFQCLNPDTGFVVNDMEAASNASWVTLHREPAGTWLAGSAQRELFRFQPGKLDPQALPVPYAGTGKLYLQPDGTVFVPADEGFSIIRHGKVERIDRKGGFPPDRAECFLLDRDGNLWIGTSGSGLTQWLGPGSWRGWDTAEGLPGPEVTRVVRSRDGTQWVATNRGLAVRSHGELLFRDAPLPNRIPQRGLVFGLAPGREGELWFSNERGILHRWNPGTGQVQTFSEENGAAVDLICFLLWHKDALWIADTKGLGRLQLIEGIWRFDRVAANATEGGAVYALASGRDGRLWAASEKGLLMFDGGRVQRITRQDGLLASNVFGVTVHPAGSVWVNYRLPLGLTEVRTGEGAPSMRHYRKADGLASEKVFSVLADGAGRVWAGTERGLSGLSGNAWFNFTRDDGLIWNDVSVNGLAEGPDGAVWISTARGLSRFAPPSTFQRRPITVVILGIHGGDGKATDLPATGNLLAPSKFQVSFAALRFTNQDSIRYRYRLGNRGEWIESEERQVNFDHVEPGIHQFEVQAREAAGPWSEPASIHLEVPAPWWSQWWSLALALWTLLALARGIWRWRYRRMLQRQEQLESAVGERTRELKEQRAKAEAANKFKDEILSNVSHEMRTPLNGILGFTDLILGTELSVEQREHLQTVQASGKTLVDIIEDLLDFAAMESGEVEIRPAECSLAEVVDQATRSVLYEVRRKGLDLRVKMAPSLPALVRVDAHRLRQILLNLVSNAVKFTDRGTVTLEVFANGISPAMRGSLRGEATEAGVQIRIVFVVADEGIGIHPDHLAVIFEPFRQLDGTRRRRNGGAGLGLAIVQRLVSAFGGSVTVISELGSGSRFTVELPVEVLPVTPEQAAPTALSSSVAGAEDSAPSSETQPAESQAGEIRIRKVLIAEDNPVNQTLLARILKTRGLHVVAVANGQAAVEAVEQDQFDLILMDIQMPVMDGIEATRQIRQREHPGAGRIPIIAVTANGLFQCRQECVDVGMDGYVVKPFGPASLFDAIARVSQLVERRDEREPKPSTVAYCLDSPDATFRD